MLHAFPPLQLISPHHRLRFLHHVHQSHSSTSSSSPTHHHSPPTSIINTLDHLLQSSSTVSQTKQIHTQIIQTHQHFSAFLMARLISIYTKFTHLNDAQIVFDNTPIESRSNILLWNSILRANMSNGGHEKALEIYVELRKMRKFGIFPDGFTFPIVIRACGSVGNSSPWGKCVHGHVIVSGLKTHLHVNNELVGMYGKIGDMEVAGKVFDEMPHRNHISWNIMISGFSRNYDCEGAFSMFKRMELEGLEPNLVTWTTVLSAYARCGECDKVMEVFRELRRKGIGASGEAVSVGLSVCGDISALSKGREIHGYVITAGFDNNVFVNNALISMYGSAKSIDDAKFLFSEMKIKNLVSWNALMSSFVEAGLSDEAFGLFLQLEKSEDLMMRPNVISWSIVIGAFASRERGDECLELFRRMLRAKIHPNAVTFASVLSTCAELGVLNLGREVHGHVVRGVMDRNILVGDGLIHMYTKCGSLTVGHLVFDRIKSKDIISWNSMIVGYGLHGLGKQALATFHEMVRSGFKPDGITFVGVLSACSHAGLVDEGRKLFNEMIAEYLITPQMEHYSCMVDLLGRAGLLQEASEIVRTMPFDPNACVWGALLNSCRMYKNTEVAEQTASHLFNSKTNSAGSYMLLSNIYAANGKWEDSAKVRTLAKRNGLKKSPGQSWIEVKKKVYMFSAGNASQLHLEDIVNILEELCLRMEIEGYIPDKSFALQDVGEEEKKQMLYGHSEKLAIAFGHMNIPPSMPIRIMKNLRVCGDCHNWTKFFSKMTNRLVIVRDGRRFHHFKEGICSCKDYW
ncbi:hypothetical protein ACHQM5_021953 [Ranunculus cassubicifolius]